MPDGEHQFLLIILNSLANHWFLFFSKRKKREETSNQSLCFFSKGNQSQLFLMSAYLKMKALKKNESE